ncbi:hypothetical protein OFN61_36625, partial [Escherichia coli]|nr:hypothetical protein [Escherichia coli]
AHAVREVARAASGHLPGESHPAPPAPAPPSSPRRALEPPSRRNTDRLEAPGPLRQAANLQDYLEEYRRSLEDPEGFWGDWARRF